jgi:hypothetical protein
MKTCGLFISPIAQRWGSTREAGEGAAWRSRAEREGPNPYSDAAIRPERVVGVVDVVEPSSRASAAA